MTFAKHYELAQKLKLKRTFCEAIAMILIDENGNKIEAMQFELA